MSRNVIFLFLLSTSSFLLAQPGNHEGAGGQYGGKRIEMMMIWKLTDYLNLTEKQAEQLFPRMRNHRLTIGKLQKEEKNLFSPIFKKMDNGGTVSQLEVNNFLKKIEALDKKKSKQKLDFVKNTEDILNPSQQIKFMQFDPHMKDQARKGMRNRYKKSPRSNNKGKKKKMGNF